MEKKKNSWALTLLKCTVHAFDHRYLDLSLIDAHVGVSCLESH